MDYFENYSFKNDELNMSWYVFFEGIRIGELIFCYDKGDRVWAWNFSIDDIHQKKGLGTETIKRAVAYYGAVYFYTGTKTELNQYAGGDYDSRYLSDEGRALLYSCIRKGIVKKQWVIDTFRNKYLMQIKKTY